MRVRAVIAWTCLLGAAPAAAQDTCVQTYTAEGDDISWERWTLDARGRVRSVHETLDPAAWSALIQYRYDARGNVVGERTRVDEGPHRRDLGWRPALRVQTERTADTVIERRPAHDDRPARATTWRLDARGLPTSVRFEPGSEGHDEERYCSYDIAGRPIFMSVRRDGAERRSRSWEWDGDRLARVVRRTADGDETVFEVRHPRSGRIEIASADDAEVHGFTGTCDQLLYEACSPILGPARADGTRPHVPRADGPVAPAAAPRPTTAFDATLLGAPLTLETIRAAYAGRTVSTTVSFYENAPDMPYPIVCIGSAAATCSTRILHGDDGLATQVQSTDPSLEGPEGIRVGARGSAVANRLEACVFERGLVTGIACRVRGHPEVEAWIDPPPGFLETSEDVPSAAVIRARRVERLEWSRTPRER